MKAILSDGVNRDLMRLREDKIELLYGTLVCHQNEREAESVCLHSTKLSRHFFSWDKKREEKTAQLFNSVDLLFLALFDIKWCSVLRKKTHYLPFLHICYAHTLIPSIYICVLNNTHKHLHSSAHTRTALINALSPVATHSHAYKYTRTLTSTLANQNTLTSTCMNSSANTDPY